MELTRLPPPKYNFKLSGKGRETKIIFAANIRGLLQWVIPEKNPYPPLPPKFPEELHPPPAWISKAKEPSPPTWISKKLDEA